MESTTVSIIDFLSDKKIIKIPSWHREYVWDLPYVLQLFDDIDSLINNPYGLSHFLGVIISKELDNPIFAIKIIDGHQRLVTISILLNALFNHFKDKRYKKALLYQGYNQDEPKIEVTSVYQDNYKTLLADSDYAFANNSKYSQAYRILLDKIESNNYSLADYLEALKRVYVVDMRIASNDNPQLIFDSTNSISVKLTKFEKIKNYIFMGLSDAEQDKILKDYWIPLMQLFADDSDGFINYLISYVSMQTTTRKVDIDNIFSEFNKYYSYIRRYKTVDDVISELFKFAQYYIRIKNADFSKDIAQQFEKIISIIDTPAIYSFLFELTDDFQNKLIPKKVFVDVLSNVYDYIKTSIDNNVTLDFTSLSQTISKLLAKKYE